MLFFRCQDQLPAIEAVAPVIQGLQVTVGKSQDTRVHPALIALFSLLLQIHLALRGHQGFHIIGLLQGFYPHIVVDHKETVFQICPCKAVFGDFSHAAVLHVIAEYMGIHRADLALSFAAAAFDDHHSLTFVAWDQAVAAEFLESSDILRIKQLIQEIQPMYGRRRFRVITDGEAGPDDFIFGGYKVPVQEQGAVGQMDPIWLRQQLVGFSRDFQEIDNVRDLFCHIGGNERLYLPVDFFLQGAFISQAAFRRKECVFRIGDFIPAEELLAKPPFVDGFPVIPVRPPIRPRCFVLRHLHLPPFPYPAGYLPAF